MKYTILTVNSDLLGVNWMLFMVMLLPITPETSVPYCEYATDSNVLCCTAIHIPHKFKNNSLS